MVDYQQQLQKEWKVLIKELVLILVIFLILIIVPFQIISSPSNNIPEEIIEQLNPLPN